MELIDWTIVWSVIFAIIIYQLLDAVLQLIHTLADRFIFKH